MAFSLGTSSPIVSNVTSISDSKFLAHRAFAWLAITRTFFGLIVSGGPLPEPTYILGWSVAGKYAGANHFRKEIDIVVNFARHGFADSVKHLQEFWLSIHHGFEYFANLRGPSQLN